MVHYKKHIYLLLSFLIAINSIACKEEHHEYHTIRDKIEDLSKSYDGNSITSEKYIKNLDLIEVTENGHTFLIPERKGKIELYACTECHTKPLEKMKGVDYQKAHWNIKLQHANENTMNCTTCHNKEDINSLTSFTGKKIDLNNSYNLCSQCHNQQYKDWAGGAHGKRIGSWAPPRASMTCVNCHNPHNPKIPSKWPARYNTQKVKERN
ncbi:cytochrome C [Wenyingzhuangia fucanilytica]|uniref:Cytochrome C n=1 Tax=Wenyingzhuangia fucanilytica TaxID=1790137 RepID=A0A1B1Y2N5_9FLAO|nr:multiheme c-type cytochrome [Wenyingzhuangia fucanilytica]ANW95032.1 cytochrome C [Wenyingzhuangia fucanilytica]